MLTRQTLLRLMTITLIALLVGCGDPVPDLCAQTEECSEGVIDAQECENSYQESIERSEQAGCGAEADALIDCFAEHNRCVDKALLHDAQCEPVLIEHRQCLSSAEES